MVSWKEPEFSTTDGDPPALTRRERVAQVSARLATFDGPFVEPRVRSVLEMAEAFAEDEASIDALLDAIRQAERAADDAQRRAAKPVWTLMEGRRAAAATAECRTARAVAEGLRVGLGPTGCFPRHAAIQASWLTSDVVALARLVAGGQTDLLPILADALEDAGCADTSILCHCRGSEPHVPDCWVPAMILGCMDGGAV